MRPSIPLSKLHVRAQKKCAVMDEELVTEDGATERVRLFLAAHGYQ